MRSALFILLILGVFLVPWWFMTGVLLLTVLLRRTFYIALIPAVLIDVIHGGAQIGDAPFRSATVLVSIALITFAFLELYLRDNVRI